MSAPLRWGNRRISLLPPGNKKQFQQGSTLRRTTTHDQNGFAAHLQMVITQYTNKYLATVSTIMHHWFMSVLFVHIYVKQIVISIISQDKNRHASLYWCRLSRVRCIGLSPWCVCAKCIKYRIGLCFNCKRLRCVYIYTGRFSVRCALVLSQINNIEIIVI